MYIDTHFHLFLQGTNFNFNPDDVVKNAIHSGVSSLWLASTGSEDIAKNIDFCKKYPDNLKTWVGWHPEGFDKYDESYLVEVLNSVFPATDYQLPIIGIGEIGVDLKWHSKETTTKQQEVFEKQIKMALKYNLPVAVHSRSAFNETKEVLQAYPDLNFVWHCYNLNIKKTEQLLQFFNKVYFGFNAIITYESGKDTLKALEIIPKNRILTETDAPFLAPRPFKYLYNTPEGVIEVYKKIAEVKKVSIEKLQEIVAENAVKII